MASLTTSSPAAGASSSSSSPTHRPITSKARGVCKYYKDPRGCYAKDKCKFLHSEPPKEGDPPALTPYDSSKLCKFYLQGYCKRGDKCWFQHTESKDKGKSPATLDEEDDLCSICFEKPITYGLLAGCSHVFCTTCITQWRDPVKKSFSAIESGNTKRCPMCREPSRFITPSSQFWRHGTSEKHKTIEAYRESMSRVPCRYFQKSLAKDKNKPLCPYGKECFYQHKKEDGTVHEFKDGVEASQRRYFAATRIRTRSTYDGFGIDFPAGLAAELGGPLFERINHDLRMMATAITDPNMPPGDHLTQRLTTVFGQTIREHTAALHNRNGRNEHGRAEDREGGEGGDILTFMRMLGALRDDSPPARGQGRPARAPRAQPVPAPTLNRPPTTTTRNGTAAVADADTESDDDEPPPNLVPNSDRPTGARTGYESDNSMPGLQTVSDSSDSEDNEDNEDDWVDEESTDGFRAGGDFDGDSFDPELFFRELVGVGPRVDGPSRGARRPPAPRPEARANRGARFSTVVDRSNAGGNNNASRNGGAGAGAGGAGANANAPRQFVVNLGQPEPETNPPVRLMEWAESILRMDQQEAAADSDDDEPMPALEPVPVPRRAGAGADARTQIGAGLDSDDEPMPALEPVPPRANARAELGAELHRVADLLDWAGAVMGLHEDEDDEDEGEEEEEESDDEPMPALEPVTANTPLRQAHVEQSESATTTQLQPAASSTAAAPPPAPPSASSNRQTTIHRVPTPRAAPSEPEPARATPADESASTPAIAPRKSERKASAQQDFTTDGRGRVISISGPEPLTSAILAPTPAAASAEAQVSDVSEDHVGLVEEAPAPAVIQRKSSEFTTDGRGRVIGHSVSSGSVSAPSATVDSSASVERETPTEPAADGNADSSLEVESGNGNGNVEEEEGTSGRGLLAWFGALF